MATAPNLLTAGNFAVLGGSTVTNTGPTVVTGGDVGVSPGSAITGFPPGAVVPPNIVRPGNDAATQQAKVDLALAYIDAEGQFCNTDLTGIDLGGLTLTPGVYCFDTSAQLTGTLTLDGQGDPNAVFIFQIGSTLTTASASNILFINGAQACNVFWQVGSSATLGTTTDFAGTIMALASITLNTGATVDGRVLARNGAVTLDSNEITVCALCPLITVSPSTLPVGGFPGAYGPVAISASGGTAPYTFAVTSGSLPPGFTLLPDGTLSGLTAGTGSFNFTITATDANGCMGATNYTLIINPNVCAGIIVNPPALPAGQQNAPYSQVISAIGGTPPYTFSVLPPSNLPLGLALNPVTGLLSGTPLVSGSFTFTVTVTGSGVGDCIGSRLYTLDIAAACPVINILPSVLAPGTVGQSYLQPLTVTAGSAPITFAVTGGSLPTGLILDPLTGIISGVPTVAGLFNFTVTATDLNGCTGEGQFEFRINTPSSGGGAPSNLPVADTQRNFLPREVICCEKKCYDPQTGLPVPCTPENKNFIPCPEILTYKGFSYTLITPTNPDDKIVCYRRGQRIGM